MDELATLQKSLQTLGLELPSLAYIIGAVVFGLIGLVAFRRGRKSGHRPTVWWGVALMLYPYAVTQTWLLYAVGAALLAGLYFGRQ